VEALKKKQTKTKTKSKYPLSISREHGISDLILFK